MNELRWDPLLKEWIIIAANRDKRPILGKTFEDEKSITAKSKNKKKKTTAAELNDNKEKSNKDQDYKCPFCPGTEEVPDANWDVLQLGNRYSSLSNDFSIPWVETKENTAIWPTKPALGKNEVILYTPKHYTNLGELSVSNMEKLSQLWGDRYKEISEEKQIKYIFIMENRGKEIGVSLEHPHGQIYSFPFLPPRIEREYNSVNQYKIETGKCLFCEIMEREIQDGRRIITENESFVCFVPYFTHFAYEIHVYSKKHVQSILDFDEKMNVDYGKILIEINLRYDALKGGIMPYIMSQHNAPCNVPNRENWHFHVEFYTIYRGPGRIKFLGGVELGCNTFINDTFPEDAAAVLKAVNIDKNE